MSKQATKTVYTNSKNGTAFIFIKPAPEVFFVQHVESGDYDFSHCKSWDEAVEEIIAEWWTEGETGTEDEDGDFVLMSKEEAREQSADSLKEYSLEEAIESAMSGYGWLLQLGYIEMVDIDEVC